MPKPTIAEIKAKTAEMCPNFFSREILKHFGQQMSVFSVRRSPKGNIFIMAPRYDEMTGERRLTGFTFRRFTGDDLEVVRDDNDDLVDTFTSGAWGRIGEHIKNH